MCAHVVEGLREGKAFKYQNKSLSWDKLWTTTFICDSNAREGVSAAFSLQIGLCKSKQIITGIQDKRGYIVCKKLKLNPL